MASAISVAYRAPLDTDIVLSHAGAAHVNPCMLYTSSLSATLCLGESAIVTNIGCKVQKHKTESHGCCFLIDLEGRPIAYGDG